ncbi:MAG: shikimate kinase [Mariprofundaceae bacterium]|nr:shikimate kinase [Mariprofundaceae bacterium]
MDDNSDDRFNESMGALIYPIILIGSMGAGKSTIGRRLAARLSVSCVDLDAVIVEHAGCSIPEIFEEQGEAAFRALESEYLKTLCQDGNNKVLATGGGAVLSEANRHVMQQSGFVIWLDARPEILARRIAGDGNRPLLKGVEPLQRARELDAQRRPLYKACADLRIDTAKCRVPQTIRTILDAINHS